VKTNSEIGNVAVVAALHKSAFASDCDAVAPMPCTYDSRSYVYIYPVGPGKSVPVVVSVRPR
jgi:hypothetical protein